MSSIENLSEPARIAYQAFLDMSDSKKLYFNCLEALDNKYQAGGAPGIAENLELEKLLSAHDKNVVAFKTAMTQVTDAEEKLAVVEMMS